MDRTMASTLGGTFGGNSSSSSFWSHASPAPSRPRTNANANGTWRSTANLSGQTPRRRGRRRQDLSAQKKALLSALLCGPGAPPTVAALADVPETQEILSPRSAIPQHPEDARATMSCRAPSLIPAAFPPYRPWKPASQVSPPRGTTSNNCTTKFSPQAGGLLASTSPQKAFDIKRCVGLIDDMLDDMLRLLQPKNGEILREAIALLFGTALGTRGGGHADVGRFVSTLFGSTPPGQGVDAAIEKLRQDTGQYLQSLQHLSEEDLEVDFLVWDTIRRHAEQVQAWCRQHLEEVAARPLSAGSIRHLRGDNSGGGRTGQAQRAVSRAVRKLLSDPASTALSLRTVVAEVKTQLDAMNRTTLAAEQKVKPQKEEEIPFVPVEIDAGGVEDELGENRHFKEAVEVYKTCQTWLKAASNTGKPLQKLPEIRPHIAAALRRTGEVHETLYDLAEWTKANELLVVSLDDSEASAIRHERQAEKGWQKTQNEVVAKETIRQEERMANTQHFEQTRDQLKKLIEFVQADPKASTQGSLANMKIKRTKSSRRCRKALTQLSGLTDDRLHNLLESNKSHGSKRSPFAESHADGSPPDLSPSPSASPRGKKKRRSKFQSTPGAEHADVILDLGRDADGKKVERGTKLLENIVSGLQRRNSHESESSRTGAAPRKDREASNSDSESSSDSGSITSAADLAPWDREAKRVIQAHERLLASLRERKLASGRQASRAKENVRFKIEWLAARDVARYTRQAQEGDALRVAELTRKLNIAKEGQSDYLEELNKLRSIVRTEVARHTQWEEALHLHSNIGRLDGILEEKINHNAMFAKEVEKVRALFKHTIETLNELRMPGLVVDPDEMCLEQFPQTPGARRDEVKQASRAFLQRAKEREEAGEEGQGPPLPEILKLGLIAEAIQASPPLAASFARDRIDVPDVMRRLEAAMAEGRVNVALAKEAASLEVAGRTQRARAAVKRTVLSLAAIRAMAPRRAASSFDRWDAAWHGVCAGLGPRCRRVLPDDAANADVLRQILSNINVVQASPLEPLPRYFHGAAEMEKCLENLLSVAGRLQDYWVGAKAAYMAQLSESNARKGPRGSTDSSEVKTEQDLQHLGPRFLGSLVRISNLLLERCQSLLAATEALERLSGTVEELEACRTDPNLSAAAAASHHFVMAARDAVCKRAPVSLVNEINTLVSWMESVRVGTNLHATVLTLRRYHGEFRKNGMVTQRGQVRELSEANGVALLNCVLRGTLSLLVLESDLSTGVKKQEGRPQIEELEQVVKLVRQLGTVPNVVPVKYYLPSFRLKKVSQGTVYGSLHRHASNLRSQLNAHLMMLQDSRPRGKRMPLTWLMREGNASLDILLGFWKHEVRLLVEVAGGKPFFEWRAGLRNLLHSGQVPPETIKFSVTGEEPESYSEIGALESLGLFKLRPLDAAQLQDWVAVLQTEQRIFKETIGRAKRRAILYCMGAKELMGAVEPHLWRALHARERRDMGPIRGFNAASSLELETRLLLGRFEGPPPTIDEVNNSNKAKPSVGMLAKALTRMASMLPEEEEDSEEEEEEEAEAEAEAEEATEEKASKKASNSVEEGEEGRDKVSTDGESVDIDADGGDDGGESRPGSKEQSPGARRSRRNSFATSQKSTGSRRPSISSPLGASAGSGFGRPSPRRFSLSDSDRDPRSPAKRRLGELLAAFARATVELRDVETRLGKEASTNRRMSMAKSLWSVHRQRVDQVEAAASPLEAASQQLVQEAKDALDAVPEDSTAVREKLEKELAFAQAQHAMTLQRIQEVRDETERWLLENGFSQPQAGSDESLEEEAEAAPQKGVVAEEPDAEEDILVGKAPPRLRKFSYAIEFAGHLAKRAVESEHVELGVSGKCLTGSSPRHSQPLLEEASTVPRRNDEEDDERLAELRERRNSLEQSVAEKGISGLEKERREKQVQQVKGQIASLQAEIIPAKTDQLRHLAEEMKSALHSLEVMNEGARSQLNELTPDNLESYIGQLEAEQESMQQGIADKQDEIVGQLEATREVEAVAAVELPQGGEDPALLALRSKRQALLSELTEMRTEGRRLVLSGAGLLKAAAQKVRANARFGEFGGASSSICPSPLSDTSRLELGSNQASVRPHPIDVAGAVVGSEGSAVPDALFVEDIRAAEADAAADQLSPTDVRDGQQEKAEEEKAEEEKGLGETGDEEEKAKTEDQQEQQQEQQQDQQDQQEQQEQEQKQEQEQEQPQPSPQGPSTPPEEMGSKASSEARLSGLSRLSGSQTSPMSPFSPFTGAASSLSVRERADTLVQDRDKRLRAESAADEAAKKANDILIAHFEEEVDLGKRMTTLLGEESSESAVQDLKRLEKDLKRGFMSASEARKQNIELEKQALERSAAIEADTLEQLRELAEEAKQQTGDFGFIQDDSGHLEAILEEQEKHVQIAEEEVVKETPKLLQEKVQLSKHTIAEAGSIGDFVKEQVHHVTERRASMAYSSAGSLRTTSDFAYLRGDQGPLSPRDSSHETHALQQALKEIDAQGPLSPSNASNSLRRTRVLTSKIGEGSSPRASLPTIPPAVTPGSPAKRRTTILQDLRDAALDEDIAKAAEREVQQATLELEEHRLQALEGRLAEIHAVGPPSARSTVGLTKEPEPDSKIDPEVLKLLEEQKKLEDGDEVTQLELEVETTNLHIQELRAATGRGSTAGPRLADLLMGAEAPDSPLATRPNTTFGSSKGFGAGRGSQGAPLENPGSEGGQEGPGSRLGTASQAGPGPSAGIGLAAEALAALDALASPDGSRSQTAATGKSDRSTSKRLWGSAMTAALARGSLTEAGLAKKGWRRSEMHSPRSSLSNFISQLAKQNRPVVEEARASSNDNIGDATEPAPPDHIALQEVPQAMAPQFSRRDSYHRRSMFHAPAAPTLSNGRGSPNSTDAQEVSLHVGGHSAQTAQDPPDFSGNARGSKAPPPLSMCASESDRDVGGLEDEDNSNKNSGARDDSHRNSAVDEGEGEQPASDVQMSSPPAGWHLLDAQKQLGEAPMTERASGPTGSRRTLIPATDSSKATPRSTGKVGDQIQQDALPGSSHSSPRGRQAGTLPGVQRRRGRIDASEGASRKRSPSVDQEALEMKLFQQREIARLAGRKVDNQKKKLAFVQDQLHKQKDGLDRLKTRLEEAKSSKEVRETKAKDEEKKEEKGKPTPEKEEDDDSTNIISMLSEAVEKSTKMMDSLIGRAAVAEEEVKVAEKNHEEAETALNDLNMRQAALTVRSESYSVRRRRFRRAATVQRPTPLSPQQRRRAARPHSGVALARGRPPPLRRSNSADFAQNKAQAPLSPDATDAPWLRTFAIAALQKMQQQEQPQAPSSVLTAVEKLKEEEDGLRGWSLLTKVVGPGEPKSLRKALLDATKDRPRRLSNPISPQHGWQLLSQQQQPPEQPSPASPRSSSRGISDLLDQIDDRASEGWGGTSVSRERASSRPRRPSQVAATTATTLGASKTSLFPSEAGADLALEGHQASRSQSREPQHRSSSRRPSRLVGGPLAPMNGFEDLDGAQELVLLLRGEGKGGGLKAALLNHAEAGHVSGKEEQRGIGLDFGAPTWLAPQGGAFPMAAPGPLLDEPEARSPERQDPRELQRQQLLKRRQLQQQQQLQQQRLEEEALRRLVESKQWHLQKPGQLKGPQQGPNLPGIHQLQPQLDLQIGQGSPGTHPSQRQKQLLQQHLASRGRVDALDAQGRPLHSHHMQIQLPLPIEPPAGRGRGRGPYPHLEGSNSRSPSKDGWPVRSRNASSRSPSKEQDRPLPPWPSELKFAQDGDRYTALLLSTQQVPPLSAQLPISRRPSVARRAGSEDHTPDLSPGGTTRGRSESSRALSRSRSRSPAPRRREGSAGPLGAEEPSGLILIPVLQCSPSRAIFAVPYAHRNLLPPASARGPVLRSFVARVGGAPAPMEAVGKAIGPGGSAGFSGFGGVLGPGHGGGVLGPGHGPGVGGGFGGAVGGGGGGGGGAGKETPGRAAASEHVEVPVVLVEASPFLCARGVALDSAGTTAEVPRRFTTSTSEAAFPDPSDLVLAACQALDLPIPLWPPRERARSDRAPLLVVPGAATPGLRATPDRSASVSRSRSPAPGGGANSRDASPRGRAVPTKDPRTTFGIIGGDLRSDAYLKGRLDELARLSNAPPGGAPNGPQSLVYVPNARNGNTYPGSVVRRKSPPPPPGFAPKGLEYRMGQARTGPGASPSPRLALIGNSTPRTLPPLDSPSPLSPMEPTSASARHSRSPVGRRLRPAQGVALPAMGQHTASNGNLPPLADHVAVIAMTWDEVLAKTKPPGRLHKSPPPPTRKLQDPTLGTPLEPTAHALTTSRPWHVTAQAAPNPEAPPEAEEEKALAKRKDVPVLRPPIFAYASTGPPGAPRRPVAVKKSQMAAKYREEVARVELTRGNTYLPPGMEDRLKDTRHRR